MLKILTFTLLSLLAFSALAEMKVIYGDDNRLDLKDVAHTLHRRLALSTAAMVENRLLVRSSQQLHLNFEDTLETGQNVCPGERFSQQPIGAMCSGFLVGEDTLVSAGHCFQGLASLGYASPQAVCRGFSWVFNYAVDTAQRNPLQGQPSNVYGCKQVVVAQLSDTQDFAVIKLDRKVQGRAPLAVRASGKIADRASLVVIGHPSGLPSKVAAGGRVLDNRDANTFLTNLDTFHGNSGSAVFDAQSGQLEGILVQGQVDYRPSNARDPRSCQVVNRCEEGGNGCELPTLHPRAPKGEVVTRIALVAPFLRAPARTASRAPARR